MNKFKKALGAFGLSVLFILTGCADKGTLGQSTAIEDGSGFNSEKNENSNVGAEIELMPITEVKETFAEESEKLKNRKFDNINFENAYFSFPDASEVCTLEYKKTDFTWSPDEAYDYMCRRIDELFPGKYSAEEKANEIRFCDSEWISEERFPNNVPTLKQYKEMNLVTEHPETIIANEWCYIEILNGILRGYDQGILKERGGYDLEALTSLETGYGYGYKGNYRIDMFDVMIAYPIVLRTDDLESEEIFHLVSGDISIAEAVKSANKYLSNLEISPRDLPYKPSVQSVIVLDIGDGCFAFCFAVVPEYKQIMYDCAKIDAHTNGISSISDTTNETRLAGHAVMYEKDKICRCRLGDLLFYYDVMETNSQTSVIPLEKAAELASNHLTWNMRFKAQGVSVVYKEISDKDHHQYPDNKALENRKITVRPCWKFYLRPTIEPQKLFHVYVDMLTGDVYTFVQLMTSEAEK